MLLGQKYWTQAILSRSMQFDLPSWVSTHLLLHTKKTNSCGAKGNHTSPNVWELRKSCEGGGSSKVHGCYYNVDKCSDHKQFKELLSSTYTRYYALFVMISLVYLNIKLVAHGEPWFHFSLRDSLNKGQRLCQISIPVTNVFEKVICQGNSS